MTEREHRSLAEKRIVVTGGAGFLGRVVVRKLRELGCREITVPRRTTCDLTRADAIARLLDQARPDVLFHLASTIDNPPGRGIVAESFRNNVLMTTQLIDAASKRGVEKMVCLGSASSYPANAPVPLREDDLFAGLPAPPRIAYAIAKRLPLIQAQAYRQQYSFRCIFLIPTNFYGPGDNFEPETCFVIPSLVRKFVEAVETGAAEVTVGGTGSATRDFMHVEDCAEGILLAAERYDKTEAVNLGSGAEVRIEELARRTASLAGYAGQILWDTSYPDGPSRRLLDTTRAEREFGFRARRSFEEGLRETIEWYRASRGRSAALADPQALASRV
jgi:GDP-L-fucose synthase